MKHQQKTTILLLFTFGAILILKLFMSLNRQFDPDEMAYLHWGYLLSQGNLPYKDFFFIIPPLYPAILSFLFLFPHSPALAICGRCLMFIGYLAALWALFTYIKTITKNSQTGLLTVIIFMAFPMLFDKTIEIRPDMIMLLFFLLSLLALRKSIRQQRSVIYIVISGILLGISILILPKIIFALPAYAVFVAYTYPKNRLYAYTRIGMGMMLPLMVFFLYLLGNGLFSQAYVSMTRYVMAANVGNATFPFWKTLSPWPIIYVQKGGISLPWIINTLLWLLMIPGLVIFTKKYRADGIFLLTLLLGAIVFMLVFPKPYVQYFIIPCAIASIASAVMLTQPYRFQTLSVIVLSGILLTSTYIQTKDRNTPLGSNRQQLEVLADVLSMIKPNEPVYDMVGSYIFRPDSYYICCHPYAQFIHHLDIPLSTLRESLIKTKTKFLVMDQKGYVFWIPDSQDLAFLLTHYLPSMRNKIYTLGSQFHCDNGVCTQYTLHHTPVNQTTTVDIVIPETYRIRTTPADLSMQINGVFYQDGDIIQWSPGTYQFSVSPTLTAFSIQLNR